MALMTKDKKNANTSMIVSGIGMPVNNNAKYDTIYTDPFLVLSTLFQALARIKSIELKVMLMKECLEMQKRMHQHEFGESSTIELTKSFCPTLISADLFIIIDKLEQSISALSMPGARLQAYLDIMSIRSTIMWKVYGIGGKQWAYAGRL